MSLPLWRSDLVEPMRVGLHCFSRRELRMTIRPARKPACWH